MPGTVWARHKPHLNVAVSCEAAAGDALDRATAHAGMFNAVMLPDDGWPGHAGTCSSEDTRWLSGSARRQGEGLKQCLSSCKAAVLRLCWVQGCLEAEV